MTDTSELQPHARKSLDVERIVLDMNAEGVPLLHIKRHLDEMGEPISRQTIYNILGRYGVRRSRADARFDQLHADAMRLKREMSKHLNGVIDKDAMRGVMSEFDARWRE